MKSAAALSAVLLAVACRAANVKTYADALSSGKEKDIMILCVGSGWMADCDKIKSAFAAAARGYSGDAVFAVYDRPAGLTREERNALGWLPCSVYGYPAAIYRDAHGVPLFVRESITEAGVAKLGEIAAKLSKMRRERDKALDAAREMRPGREKAAALGKALSPLMDPVVGGYSERILQDVHRALAPMVEEIKAADPSDEDGWAMKYSFTYLPIVESKILEGDASEIEDMTSGWLEKPALLPVQKQMIHAMRFKARLDAAGQEGDLGPALAALDAGIALDPNTTMAEAMRNMKAYYTGPVKLSGMKWLSRDNRPRLQKAVLDCSGSLNGPGTYIVEFRPRAPGTEIRNVHFRGCPAGDFIGGDAWRCKFMLKAEPVLELELRGTGWFPGHGDIAVRRD